EVFGGKLKNLDEVYHGVSSEIKVTAKSSLFNNIQQRFPAARYHSWIVDKEDIPSCLEIIAVDSKENIMALSHKSYNVKGVQFHPESILTEVGEQIIRNWLFDHQKMEINFPSAGNNAFNINAIATKLLFC
ncbi:MAG: aminodeoxychorismate/anthranilate synthase component II, partial [Bacteroidales bacterium]